MTLQGIVTRNRITVPRLDASGLHGRSIHMRARDEDYSVFIKIEPTLTINPGDEIAVEIDPAKAKGRFVQGLPGRLTVVARNVLQPVTIQATINELVWPKNDWDVTEETPFGAKLRVRNPAVASVRDRGAYITFVKGNAPAGVKLRRGSRVALTGVVFHRHNGTAELLLGDKAVRLLPDKPAGDPAIVAARRSMRLESAPKPDDDKAATDYTRLLTASKRDRLESELGNEWPVSIAEDRTLLDGEAFARWKNDFKDALVTACINIKSRLAGLESDLLACEVSDEAIKHIVARYFPNDGISKRGNNDAMVMVRAGHLRFMQARRLNELGRFFNASINEALGALWDYVHVALEGGNSAVSLDEARQWLRMQDGFEDAAIDKAFASVGEAVAPAATLLGEHKHKLVYVGDPRNQIIAFQEIERTEARLLAAVRDLNEPISFKPAPFQDARLASDADQCAAVTTALTQRISIITGGPGTGKTSTMKEIVAQLREDTGDYKGGATAVTISARAARVVEKVASVEALTFQQFLHRHRNATNVRSSLSPRRAVIFDETSMFSSEDLRTAIEIARDVGYERIILAGDKDQLPPVGWGAPFADLIKSNVCPVTTLNTIHRTDAGGGIARICRDVREGNPLRRDYPNVEVYDAKNDDIASVVSGLYSQLVAGGASPNDVMVLSPYSAEKQDFGAPALNLAIREALGLPDRMTVGDIVIGTKNERSPRYILNGSRGVVMREGREVAGVDYRHSCPRLDIKEKTDYADCGLCGGDTTIIKFDCARTVEGVEHYCPGEIRMRANETPIKGNGKGARRKRDIRRATPPKTSWGYASGVHKAQGGEAPIVIAVVSKAVPSSFGKAALYTAFSRASGALVIVGDFDAIPGIVKRTRERLTVLSALRSDGAVPGRDPGIVDATENGELVPF
jgi:hypothetical protein